MQNPSRFSPSLRSFAPAGVEAQTSNHMSHCNCSSILHFALLRSHWFLQRRRRKYKLDIVHTGSSIANGTYSLIAKRPTSLVLFVAWPYGQRKHQYTLREVESGAVASQARVVDRPTFFESECPPPHAQHSSSRRVQREVASGAVASEAWASGQLTLFESECSALPSAL